MGSGVIADEVAGGGYLADELGALADEAADEEEGGVDLVAGEDFEEALGGFVVGAVVVGEGDFVGLRRGDESGAEELGLRVEGGVGQGACWRGEDCCGFYEGVRHVLFIVLSGGKTKTTAKAIDQSLRLRLRSGLRQSGGRLRGWFRRGAEAPLYLRGNSNSNCNSNNKGKSNSKGKSNRRSFDSTSRKRRER